MGYMIRGSLGICSSRFSPKKQQQATIDEAKQCDGCLQRCSIITEPTLTYAVGMHESAMQIISGAQTLLFSVNAPVG